jgi:hypothetical protein
MQRLEPSRTVDGVSPRSFSDFEKSSRVKFFLEYVWVRILELWPAPKLHTLENVG